MSREVIWQRSSYGPQILPHLKLAVRQSAKATNRWGRRARGDFLAFVNVPHHRLLTTAKQAFKNPPTDLSDQSKDPAQNSSSPPTCTNPPSPPKLGELIEALKKLKKSEKDQLARQLDAYIRIINPFRYHMIRVTQDVHDTLTTSSSHDDLSLLGWVYFFIQAKVFRSSLSDWAKSFEVELGKLGYGSIGNILAQIGRIILILQGIRYLTGLIEKVSHRDSKCLKLLKKMVNLASHIKEWNDLIPEHESNGKREKLANTFRVIVEISMSCVRELYSAKFFSFGRSLINPDKLDELSFEINHLRQDLATTVNRPSLKDQLVWPEISIQEYPEYAVGIEKQVKRIIDLLNIDGKEDCSAIDVVIICGFGGIGKTTLAQAVVSTVDRSYYNYARIFLKEPENNKNKYTEMQQHILRDAFPNYNGGREIKIRDPEDGKDKLREAFTCKGSKPVFFYIDNALHIEDLEALLPRELERLPQHSKILITSRTLGIVVNFVQSRGLRIKIHPVETLSNDDEAKLTNIKAVAFSSDGEHALEDGHLNILYPTYH